MDKEFELNNLIRIDFDLQNAGDVSLEELRAELARKVNDLIQHDFQHLVYLLYRIDIDEGKLRRLLREFPGEDAGALIADLIIERQAQKVRTREQFKRKSDQPGEDDW